MKLQTLIRLVMMCVLCVAEHTLMILMSLVKSQLIGFSVVTVRVQYGVMKTALKIMQLDLFVQYA